MPNASMEVWRMECQCGIKRSEFRFYLRGEPRGDVIPTMVLLGYALPSVNIERVARQIVGTTYVGPEEFLQALTKVDVRECRDIHHVLMTAETLSSP
jgi:hypothetical protein